MIKITIPPWEQHWQKNKEWYYYDIRSFRYKLTDKATKKALQSYLDDYLPGWELGTWEELRDCLRDDLLEYQKNKHRYKFNKNEYDEYFLETVDGKEPEAFSLMDKKHDL